MTVRRLPLAVGVLALVTGTAFALGLGPSLPAPAESILFVAVVLVGGLVAGVATLARVAEGPRSDPLPTPGASGRARVPGAVVDRRLAALGSADEQERGALRERIEAVAVATIARAEDCSPDEARRQLEAWTWTDDEHAAAYFSGDSPPRSIGERARSLVRGESAAQRTATRVIAALHRRAEEE